MQYEINNGNKKETELCLKPFSNMLVAFRELFDKNMNLEKEINELKNNYNIIKEENNKIKQDNINLKNEVELLKNKHNDDIGDLQMQILNMSNQYQQEINQLKNKNNEISQQLLNLNMIVQQNNNLVNNLNNFNLMNQNMINSNKISVTFAFTDGRKFNINCKRNDLASRIINKFKIKDNFLNQNMRFLFSAVILYENRTANELGLYNNSTIVVIPMPPDFIFKISGLNNIDFLFIIPYNERKKVSELINFYLSKSGLNHRLRKLKEIAQEYSGGKF